MLWNQGLQAQSIKRQGAKVFKKKKTDVSAISFWFLTQIVLKQSLRPLSHQATHLLHY